MKLLGATIVLSALQTAASAAFYPIYSPNQCVNNSTTPKAGLTPGGYSSTLEGCCGDFFSWETCKCIADSGGTPCTGSGKFYADYSEGHCVKDCPTGGADALCGGLATPADVKYDTADLCCDGKFQSVAKGKCVADSNGVTYSGTSAWYVSWGSNTCKQDCAVATNTNCGGVILDRSTTHADAEKCCTAHLGSVPKEVCVAMSDYSSTGTGMFYASTSMNKCIVDADAASATCPDSNHTCTRHTGTQGKVYSTGAACCSGSLGWLPASYCESLTTGVPTLQWYVDYDKQICKQDCDSGVECQRLSTLSSPPQALYASASACCAGKLNWITPATCEALSVNGTATGTSKWYVSYEDKKCVRDCPSGGLCGGLAAAWDQLFDDAATCCKARLSDQIEGKCEAESNGNTWAGTADWYVNYEDNKCVQDCAESVGTTCGGVLEGKWNSVYDDAEKCCAAKLSYINKDLCKAFSLGTGGTGKYYADQGTNQCIADLETCGTGISCARATATSGTLYDTAAACCKDKLSWVPEAYCVAKTTGTSSNKWFVNEQSNICQQDCLSGPTCATPSVMPNSMYDTAEQCCVAKLGWISKESCVAVSTSGINNSNGTGLWYNMGDNTCQMDCDSSITNCGGKLGTTAYKKLYTTPKACCQGEHWFNSDLCVAMSTGAHTDKWYINYQDGQCDQDCDAATNGNCTGYPSDLSVELFTSAKACCTAKLSYSATCEAKSTGLAASGSGRWYVNWESSICVKDCPTSSTDAACGGLANDWDKDFYASASSCCNRLSWKDFADCAPNV